MVIYCDDIFMTGCSKILFMYGCGVRKENVDGYGDNNVSLSPIAMGFLSRIGADDYLMV